MTVILSHESLAHCDLSVSPCFTHKAPWLGPHTDFGLLYWFLKVDLSGRPFGGMAGCCDGPLPVLRLLCQKKECGGHQWVDKDLVPRMLQTPVGR